MAHSARLPPPPSKNTQETPSAPRPANGGHLTSASSVCRVPHPQASATSIIHPATTEHGASKYSRPHRQSWLHSDIPFRLISTEMMGPFKASPWNSRSRENRAAQSNASKAQLPTAVTMNQGLPSVEAATSRLNARRSTLDSGRLAHTKQLKSPVNADTSDEKHSPKKRMSSLVVLLDALPMRTNSTEVATTAKSLAPLPMPQRIPVSVPTPAPQTTLVSIPVSVSRKADAKISSDGSKTTISGISVEKGCAATTLVATHASGLRKLTAYTPPTLPIRSGPKMTSVSATQPILATYSYQKNLLPSATFSTRSPASKLIIHRRSSVPSVPYYHKRNGKIQLTLPLVSRSSAAPTTSDALSTDEITEFRKHSLDSSMDRLLSSESLKAPRSTLTADQQHKPARQKPQMSSTTSAQRPPLSTASSTPRSTPAPGPVASSPTVKRSPQRAGKNSSILVAAINAFPEFRAQNEEFQHLGAKQHASQSAKNTSKHANANDDWDSSMVLDVDPAVNTSAFAGADVRIMNQSASRPGPSFDMEKHSVKTTIRTLFVPSAPEHHLSNEMELVERIPETPIYSPLVPSSSSMVSDDGLIFDVSTSVKAKSRSQEDPETSRKSTRSHREGKDPNTASRKPPSKRRRKVGGSTSPGSSPSITSSAVFEANMFDIEQYVDQDLQGYNRLSY